MKSTEKILIGSIDCSHLLVEYDNTASLEDQCMSTLLISFNTSQKSRDKSFLLRKVTRFVPQFRIFDNTLSCFVCSSLHLSLKLRCTVPLDSAWFHMVPLRPLVGLRPLSKIAQFSHFVSSPFSFILSFYLTITTTSLSDLVQDTTPEAVSSKCWCHERSKQSRSSQGYMAWCGCHESLIALVSVIEVFCRGRKKSQLNRNFPSGW